MSKAKKLMGIILLIMLIIPFTVVKASTKTDAIVDVLKESAKLYNGNVNYEDDVISIEWSILINSLDSEFSLPYDGSIIEYNPGEITSFEEAEMALSSYMYTFNAIQASLKVNGYTDEQIQAFFQSEEYQPTYEINGFIFNILREELTFTNEDDLTITLTPMSIKVDVTKANLNVSDEDTITIKDTTIEDVVDYLNNDKDFTQQEYEGQLMYENSVTNEDNLITIKHTDYFYKDYLVSFLSEDGIITYESDAIENYDDAESVLSHEMYANSIMVSALKLNGYTMEQIQEFIENNEFDYEINGIEVKEIGLPVEYTNEDESTITVAPVSIKIDLEKANLNKLGEQGIEYVVLNGDNQTFDLLKDNDLSFRFSIDYDTFVSEGKVYIDGKEVSSDNYKLSKGSTIVTFNKEYTSTLNNGKHTIKVAVNDGSVSTEFTINTVKNPTTSDNITIYLFMLGLSITLMITGLYLRRKRLN